MLNIINIIDKIKKLENIKFDKEVANILGIQQVRLSKWKARNTIDYEILKKYSDRKKIDINWLMSDNRQNENNINNNINVNKNNGHININSNITIKDKIYEELEKLSNQKQEYFYHLIKAETLKD